MCLTTILNYVFVLYVQIKCFVIHCCVGLVFFTKYSFHKNCRNTLIDCYLWPMLGDSEICSCVIIVFWYCALDIEVAL